MAYQILKNFGPGYHSRTQSPSGHLTVLCDRHISLDAAKSACKGRAKGTGGKIAWTSLPSGMWEGRVI